MAFVVRSPRVGPIKRSTPAPVGPGTYDPAEPVAYRPQVSYAPFTSSSDRMGNSAVNYGPGPGQYHHQSSTAQPRQRASSASFVSRTGRGNATKSRPATANIGPGSYDLQNTWVKKGSQPRKQKHASQVVEWVKVTSAPSIPTYKESYGYERNKEGDLVVQPPPSQGYSGSRGSSAGPGEYDPDRHGGFGSRKSRGTDFHRSKHTRIQSQSAKGRSKKQVQLSVGPGSYFPDKVVSIAHEASKKATKKSAAFSSKVTRGQKKKEATGPGPGTYMTISSFDKAKQQTEPDYQFFGSKTGRTDDRRDQTPGPGAYGSLLSTRPDNEPVEERPFKGGFLSTSTRFTRPKTASEVGPGAYNNLPNTNMSYELSKKIFGRNSSFGTTEARLGSKNKATSKDTPGPGTYQERRLLRPVRPNAVFASSSSRMDKSKVRNGPAPGDYDPALEAIGSKDVHRGSNAFKTTSRETRPVGTYTADKNNVGPGTYNTTVRTPTGAGSGNTASSAFKSSENRFDVEKRQYKIPSYNATAVNVPGPGTYTADDSMLKRSFNITVGS